MVFQPFSESFQENVYFLDPVQTVSSQGQAVLIADPDTDSVLTVLFLPGPEKEVADGGQPAPVRYVQVKAMTAGMQEFVYLDQITAGDFFECGMFFVILDLVLYVLHW